MKMLDYILGGLEFLFRAVLCLVIVAGIVLSGYLAIIGLKNLTGTDSFMLGMLEALCGSLCAVGLSIAFGAILLHFVDYYFDGSLTKGGHTREN